ncbi:putative serine/threonine-protein kinase iks1 [Dissophora ornata]|nr:putative serine/threonine-protein kinase iks1 [Dissophora ornata]
MTDDAASSFMDTNYFRMLADANIALSRRGSLPGDSGTQLQSHSPIGSPTSSGRVSIDLDNQIPSRDDINLNNSNADSSNDHNRSNTQEHPDSPHLSHNALNQGYYDRFFIEQKKLGRGFRGSVFLCQHVLDGIHLGEYAIKKVAVGDNHDWLVQMLREVHLLERLHHPNIVAYKHAWLENHQLHKFGPEVACLFILMECANGGNLEEYIERPPDSQLEATATTAAEADGSIKEAESKKHMTARERILQSKRQRLQGSLPSPTSAGDVGSPTERGDSQQPPRRYLSITEIWSFFFDICEGLAHLHRLGIIHRDLKPPNLLLSYSSSQIKGTKGERPRILITDFGECEILDQAAKRDRTGATGTLEFLAPELLAVDADGRYTDEFSFKGDMWSLGMVLYYLCYSRLPYSQIEDVDILRTEIRQFKSIQIPDDEHDEGREDRVIPEELKILIRILLSPEKSKRPSCDDILTTLSHQRDRMMHGDMDVPATPIRASSSTSAAGFDDKGAKSKEVHKADEYRTDENEGAEDKAASASTSIVTAKRRLSTSGSSRDLQLHRQHYHPIAQRTSGATTTITTTTPAASGLGRRPSRTTLLRRLSPVAGETRLTSSPDCSQRFSSDFISFAAEELSGGAFGIERGYGQVTPTFGYGYVAAE